eukprot:gene1569-12694_t
MNSNPPESPKILFIGNIPSDCSEQDIQALLSPYGEIASFRMILDNVTGKSKGFAFCEFIDAKSAVLAQNNLDGTMLNGRNLQLILKK